MWGILHFNLKFGIRIQEFATSNMAKQTNNRSQQQAKLALNQVTEAFIVLPLS